MSCPIPNSHRLRVHSYADGESGRHMNTEKGITLHEFKQTCSSNAKDNPVKSNYKSKPLEWKWKWRVVTHKNNKKDPKGPEQSSSTICYTPARKMGICTSV